MTAKELAESLDFPAWLRNRGITVPDDVANELRTGPEPDRCSAYGALHLIWRLLNPTDPEAVRDQQRRERWYAAHPDEEPGEDARADLVTRLKRAASGADEPTSPAGALGRLLFGTQEETGEPGEGDDSDEQG